MDIYFSIRPYLWLPDHTPRAAHAPHSRVSKALDICTFRYMRFFVGSMDPCGRRQCLLCCLGEQRGWRRFCTPCTDHASNDGFLFENSVFHVHTKWTVADSAASKRFALSVLSGGAAGAARHAIHHGPSAAVGRPPYSLWHTHDHQSVAESLSALPSGPFSRSRWPDVPEATRNFGFPHSPGGPERIH
jgi:hypothetical protein